MVVVYSQKKRRRKHEYRRRTEGAYSNLAIERPLLARRHKRHWEPLRGLRTQDSQVPLDRCSEVRQSRGRPGRRRESQRVQVVIPYWRVQSEMLPTSAGQGPPGFQQWLYDLPIISRWLSAHFRYPNFLRIHRCLFGDRNRSPVDAW